MNYSVEFGGKTYEVRHGGAFDRGSADSYYGRPPRPHYFLGDTYTSEEVAGVNVAQEFLEDYYAGYEYNEQCGDKKSWD